MFEFYKNPSLNYFFCPPKDIDLIKKVAEEQISIGKTPDDKLHLLLFFQSISNVSRNYLCYNLSVLENDSKEDPKEVFLLERTFAYELYRQWENLLEVLRISLRVDAEIGKKITDNTIEFERLKQIEGDHKEPDLVLHSSQGTTDNHILICEIKRNQQLDDKKVKNDLIKICHYIDPKIWGGKPYTYGCFIVINKDFDELRELIKNTKEQLEEEIKEKELKPDYSCILCIAYNGESVKWELLSKIFNDKNK